MAVKSFKPTSPGRRQMTVSTFEEITASKLRHLLHVQLAGVMLLPLAACNFGMLLLGIIWFASALYGAKTEWEKR